MKVVIVGGVTAGLREVVSGLEAGMTIRAGP